MADIFLSYTERDRDQARRIAAMLESVGWTIWWDRRIPAGETWRSVLEKALENMRCMMVLWSTHSIESEWVHEEATEGHRLGKLVPVLIEEVRPPPGFREIQAADLTNWDGSREFEGMRLLLTDLENILGKPAPVETKGRTKPIDHDPAPYDSPDLTGGGTTTDWWSRHRMAVMAAVAVLLLAAGAVYIGLSSRESPVAPPPVHESGRQELRRDPSPAKPTSPPPTPVAKTPAPAEPAPAPVAPEVTQTPFAKLPTKEKPPVKHAETAHMTSARCADLLARIQLGESLSDQAQSVFRKECQQ